MQSVMNLPSSSVKIGSCPKCVGYHSAGWVMMRHAPGLKEGGPLRDVTLMSHTYPD